MGGDGPEPSDPLLEDSVELVRRARAGNRDALERLLERYAKPLRGLVRLHMSREARRAVESMDIVNETLEVAARKIETFEPRSRASILYWLEDIAVKKLSDVVEHERAAKRDHRRTVSLSPPDSSDSSPGFEPEGREKSPSQEVERMERHAIIEEECINALPSAEREAIVWRDYRDATWEEVAKATGRASATAAEDFYRRARNRLEESVRRRLGHDYE
jgi:RNA polymerase sigma-70 factor (ECF subfamily)